MKIRNVKRRNLSVDEMCFVLIQEHKITLVAIRLADSFINASDKHSISWKRIMFWDKVKRELMNKY